MPALEAPRVGLADFGPELDHGRIEARSRYRPQLAYLDLPGQERRLVDVGGAAPTPEQLRRRRPEFADYTDLALLQDADPEAAEELWQRIRTKARQALETGQYAARCAEVRDAPPYTRAIFLEFRDALARDWKPKGAMEWGLIDNLTQTHLMRNRWLSVALNFEEVERSPANSRPSREETDAERRLREEEDDYNRRMEAHLPPRLSTAAAQDRAFEMVEKCDRMLVRTVRTLQNLRRYAPQVHIQNFGQVNVGEKQVNQMHADGTGALPALVLSAEPEPG